MNKNLNNKFKWGLGIGDWGLGIGDWGLGPIPNPQSPIPNPQSPIPNQNILIFKNDKNKNINLLKIIIIRILFILSDKK